MTSAKLRKEQAEELYSELGLPLLYAKDAMIRPFLLYADDDADKILKKLKKEHINACIVVSKDKRFMGEISDNDIIRLFLQQVKYEPLVQILNHGYRREFIYKSAKDMMRRHNFSVKVDTPINDVIRLVFRKGFEYIPVLEENKKVVGVITPSSLIKLLKDY